MDDAKLLLEALAQLDRLAALGAGKLTVVPTAATTIGQGNYEGVPYVSWPKPDYDAIQAAWWRLGLFGRSQPFGANDRIPTALLATSGTYGAVVAVGLLRTGISIDAARQALRQDLQTAGLLKRPTGSGSGGASGVPWGWILGTAALGLGLGFTLYFADRAAAQRELPAQGDAS